MSGRDELLRKQYAREAEAASGFAARMRAREKAFALGGEDPWTREALGAELARSEGSGTAAALEDAGRALLASNRLEELAEWLGRLSSSSREDAEALAVMRAMLAIRESDNEGASKFLDGIPNAEAVAIHGLALLQLGRAEDAAARLEVLLAADALDEQGELAAKLLPESMPVLALFLTACATSAERRLARGDRASAAKFAMAAGDALRRYATAEPPEGPSREEIGALIARVQSGPS